MSVAVDLKSILFVAALGIGSGYYIWNPLVQKRRQEAIRQIQQQTGGDQQGDQQQQQQQQQQEQPVGEQNLRESQQNRSKMANTKVILPLGVGMLLLSVYIGFRVGQSRSGSSESSATLRRR
ncbi:hypothetical protein TYRP_023402 [Tyrophagus putrescentiae]|nr:hypothetical protein TYRP_023402 [Tyrophagus putrescentiae]